MVNKLYKITHPLSEYLKIISKIEKKQKRSKKHKENISKIVRFLAINGPNSTWEISKKIFSSHPIKTGNDMVGRIIEGRNDIHINKDGRKIENHSDGLESLEIVKKMKKTDSPYTLTSYGMLYAIKSNNFSSQDFSKIAENNKELFPLIFNKINYLRKYKIRISHLNMIANGNLMEFELIDAPSPYNDILTFLVAEYPGPLDPDRFAYFIQLWFFTYLIWKFFQTDGDLKKWLQIVRNDNDIQYEYFNKLFYPAISFYDSRYRFLSKIFGSI